MRLITYINRIQVQSYEIYAGTEDDNYQILIEFELQDGTRILDKLYLQLELSKGGNVTREVVNTLAGRNFFTRLNLRR